MATTTRPRILAQSARPEIALDHSRIPELDGIRAIAIWMVLSNHIFYGWVPPEHDFAPIPSFIIQVIRHGWLGVDLFFILSGFLITGILLDSRNKPHYFRNFYARRFLRIMPLYLVVVLVFCICYSHHWKYFILSTFFAANLANLFSVDIPHGPGVLWSLAVEEHFYLLWPLLVYFLDRRKLTILAVCIISFSPIARGVAVAQGMQVATAVSYYSWFRLDGLALGGLLALWVRSPNFNSRNSYRLAALLVALSLFITAAGIPFGLMHKGTLGTALRFNQAQFPFAAFFLVALVLQGTWFTTFLRTPLVRLSGRLSYCLYLIHLALGDGYQAFVQRFDLRSNSMFTDLGAIVVRGVFIVLASFSLAMLSKKYLEEPFLRLKRYF